MSISTVGEKIETWTAEDFSTLTKAGAKMYQRLQIKGDVAWTPVGWMIVEKCVNGHNITYGVRKAMYLHTAAILESFNAIRSLYAKVGRNVARFDKAQELTKAQQEERAIVSASCAFFRWPIFDPPWRIL